MLLSRTAPRPAAPVARVAVVLACLAGLAAVVCQIVYSQTDPAERVPLTLAAVVAFALASAIDAAARAGVRALVALVLVAAGGGLLVEAVGVATGFPFGDYAYTGDLGWSVLGVPAVVPLAWLMMAWPALLVGRALAAGPWVVPVAAWALASWDVFLDPQMVDAGHWAWADPTPGLPGVDGIPLTNFAGWVVVALAMVAVLHRVVPRDVAPADVRRGPAPLLYLWTYGSSVWAHSFFFGRPWVSLVGGVLMGVVAIPYAVAVARGSRR
ncbi:carotenoid biosynthesis protein [Actinokineospora bangkokensis]|uniref:Carotenoid biosynthesis protein n=1 Tax=Actinokineospora bangkokensis TaxID=1193682 RepID=A0A1Q9LNQ4_9PSEU|nr:carotenoid biosynthesis protein [Actinokineospora bangkokensis]OLR93687.1 hypothetical protein BJP25_15620 [Actinokineospora bangkokensis]